MALTALNQDSPSKINLDGEFYIGLMSGTSMDGVDGVIMQFAPEMRTLAYVQRPLPAALRAELLALNDRDGVDELHRAAIAAQTLTVVYSDVVQELLRQAHLEPQQITAIGAHGQTVRHQPSEGYTLQLNAPALLAELTGIDVAADFRSRDVAAGGQGAPLVPAFHAGIFAQAGRTVAVLNLGGISNFSVLCADGRVIGFDAGPANVLMDSWVHDHQGQSYDANGAWAASGQVSDALLGAMLQEPYFQQAVPKSTGRDLFNNSWLKSHLDQFPNITAVDVQATLCELTARTCADALRQHAPLTDEVLVCGGGALNGHLMSRLQYYLEKIPVISTAERGMSPLQVEACAFAWLAWALKHRVPANLPSVTGARGPRLLGAWYGC